MQKLFKIVKDSAPSLRKRSEEVTEINQEVIDLVNNMTEYLKLSQDDDFREKHQLREGVGLAAPQIGHNIKALVVYYHVRVHALYEAQAVADRTGSERGVEREAAGLQLAYADAVLRAGKAGGEQVLFGIVAALDDSAYKAALAVLYGKLHAFRKAPFRAGLYHYAVHDYVYAVLKGLGEADLILAESLDLPVDAYANEALALYALQDLFVHALLLAHHRGQQRDPGALALIHDEACDLVHALAADGPPADRAVRHAYARVQKAQIVVDFRDGSDRGARVLGGGLLVYGNGRGKAIDGVHVGLVDLAEELPCVGREALHVAALAFGVDGIESQGALARARKPGDDHHLVPWYRKVYILEVMGARALDD